MYAKVNITCQPKQFQIATGAPYLYDSGAILPELFFGPPAGISTMQRGELALMYAVLEDALRCFQVQFLSNSPQARRQAREAEEWFFNDDPYWPFSFMNICAMLGLEPGYIRSGLLRLRQHPPTQVRRERWRVVISKRRSVKRAA
jgi:hypothetical protein